MTVVILAGCVAAFATLVGLVLLHPTINDPEHTLDASRRRHPSSRQPTHVRRTPRPYDWAKDEETP